MLAVRDRHEPPRVFKRFDNDDVRVWLMQKRSWFSSLPDEGWIAIPENYDADRTGLPDTAIADLDELWTRYLDRQPADDGPAVAGNAVNDSDDNLGMKQSSIAKVPVVRIEQRTFDLTCGVSVQI